MDSPGLLMEKSRLVVSASFGGCRRLLELINDLDRGRKWTNYQFNLKTNKFGILPMINFVDRANSSKDVCQYPRQNTLKLKP